MKHWIWEDDFLHGYHQGEGNKNLPYVDSATPFGRVGGLVGKVSWWSILALNVGLNQASPFDSNDTGRQKDREKKYNYPQHPDLRIDNAVLVTSNSFKILGVTFDCKLTFEKHIRNVASGISQKVGILLKYFSVWWRSHYDELF